MEQISEQIAQPVNSWNLAKLKRAERLLLKGHSPSQVGSILHLSQNQIAELEVDAADIEPRPEIESHQEWRRRKSEEVEKKLVAITENHLDGVKKNCSGILDPETMTTVKDASQIAHKWLRNGEDGVKSLTINFSALAQVRPQPLPDGTGEVLEVESEAIRELETTEQEPD